MKDRHFSADTEGALDLRLTLVWLAVALVAGVTANIIAALFEAAL